LYGTAFLKKEAISWSITYIWDNIANIGVVSKNFGVMGEKQMAEITLKTECQKNAPIICKNLHLSSAKSYKKGGQSISRNIDIHNEEFRVRF